MKIVIAPDSFKGTFTAVAAADIIERGVKEVFPDANIVKVPMADGGEGTVEALVKSTGGCLINCKAVGPLGKKVDAYYGILGDSETAVIETAAASGITLIPADKRNPLVTTTYGTGELIKDALDRGCRKFIIGLGGSATNDGGAGMAAALGIRLLDENGNELGLGGGKLGKLYKIDCSGLDKRLHDCSFKAACDVDNPLCGKYGASYVFGPQKGAGGQTVAYLDKCLEHYAEIVSRDVGTDIMNIPGAGAAGGLGGGIVAFLGAQLVKGAEIISKAAKLDKKLANADLVITGEGAIDRQTSFGKTPYGVAQIAKKYGKPVIAIAGKIGKGADELYSKGFDCIVSTSEGPATLEEAMENGMELLQRASARIMRAVRIGKVIK